jgi:hypothetical protein
MPLADQRLLDDFCAPSLLVLTVHDLSADIVLKPDLFTIRREQRPLTIALDTLLQTR